MDTHNLAIGASLATAALLLVAAAPVAEAGPIGQVLSTACGLPDPVGAECKKHRPPLCDALEEYANYTDSILYQLARTVPQPVGQVIDDEAKVQSGVKRC